MKEVYIIDAKRTAIGSFLGSLSGIEAPKLGAEVIKSIIKNNPIIEDKIDEVILGQVITGGKGQNPARQTVIHAGLKNTIPAFTVNKVCGSGLKAVALACSAIMSGQAEIIIAGGQENMSTGLHASLIRMGKKFGDVSMIDTMMYDGLTDAFSGTPMGITAENIAKKFGISRERQDEFSYNSQKKASVALQNGVFMSEIIPISVAKGKEEVLFNQDEGIRPSTTLEGLAKLKPVFDPKGTVTAGSSSTINDGAAMLLIASGEAVKKYNLKPLARIVSFASAGVDPDIMGTGPVPASKLALLKAGWSVEDLDLIEANEAFASQAIYVNDNMQWDTSKVNVNGGAIALGHPIGASGSRVLVSLVSEMLRRKANKGLTTLCIGGGMGIAMCIEKAN
jgi:acetyl-CoA C-acetyltransferase